MLRRWSLCILCLALQESQAFGQGNGFDALSSAFETRLNAAAESWKRKQPARALDGFMEAREWISRMPIPHNDTFAMSGCRALMTYATVLARLVESETEKGKNSSIAPQIESQAKQWAEILSKQSEAWSQVRPTTPMQSELRNRWTKRFQSVMSKTRNRPVLE